MFNKKKKKEKNCNKLLALFTTATALLFGLVGVGVGLMKTQFKSALAVSYNDEEYGITFDINELNNYTFENFSRELYSLSNDEGYNVNSVITYFDYNDYEFSYSEVETDENEYLGFVYSYTDPSMSIYLTIPNFLFSLEIDDVESSFEHTLYIEFIALYFDDIKSAIELDIQANQPNPQQPMLDFVQILIGGIVSVANGVATGVSTMAKALFLEVNSQGAIIGLSVFGGIIAIFSGLALAIAITSKVYTWITSLGN